MSEEKKCSKPKFLFLLAEELVNCVDKPDAGPERTFLEKLDPLIADPVLMAVRSSFSLTYLQDDSLDGMKNAVRQIKDLGANALFPLNRCLVALRLARVGSEKMMKERSGVFKFVIVPPKDLRERVTDQETGRETALIELVDTRPADDVIIAMRRILRLTFSEIYTSGEHRYLLARIRQIAAQAIIPCNSFLEMINVEPVATPSLLPDENDLTAEEEVIDEMNLDISPP